MTHKGFDSFQFLWVAPLVFSAVPLFAQTGVPDDWSHHHLIFSNPGTIVDALQHGSVDKWQKTINDPRFQMQTLKRNARPKPDPKPKGHKGPPSTGTSLERDWSMSLAASTTTGTTGDGEYPAKFSFGISAANCDDQAPPDYVVFNTSLAGSSSQASIIAYDNLYSGCTGSHPLGYWAYNTNGGTIVTSVVLSTDGSKVAFVQTESSVAHLVVLKWSKNGSATVGAPTTLTNNASCFSSAAPCMHSITMSGSSPTDTNSSPFYDYASDTLWVGDDAGALHKFHPVFNGEVAEVGSPFKSGVGTGALTSPIYDGVSGFVFVGINTAKNTQRLAKVDSSANVTTTAILQTHGGSLLLPSAPVVDSSAGTVYIYVNHGDSPVGTDAHNPVLNQFPTSFASGATASTTALLGGGSSNPDTLVVYPGTFDNTYYTSASGASPAGTLYACGIDSGAGKLPALWRTPVTSGGLGTPVAVNTIGATASSICSPVSELFHGNTVQTTLSALSGSGDASISVASGANFNNNDYIEIDNEVMLVTSGGGTTTLAVTRGRWGSTGAGHASGARVENVTNGAVITSTLAVASGTGTTICPASATGFSIGDFIQIDVEVMTITALSGTCSSGNPLTVTRGVRSTTNVNHTINTAVKDVTLDRIFLSEAGTGASGEPCTSTTGCIFMHDVTTRIPVTTAAAGLPSTGGTGGIIIDNTSVSVAGASQVYYSTLGNATCGSSSHGCAVQASQAGLQ